MRRLSLSVSVLVAVATACDGSGLVRDGLVDTDAASDGEQDSGDLDGAGEGELPDVVADVDASDSDDGDIEEADAPLDSSDETDDEVAPDAGDTFDDVFDSGPDAADTLVDTVPDASDGDDGDAVEDVPTDVPWRSRLYPEDWAPGFEATEGARLQDYSYAGYHRGERPLGAGLGAGGVDSLTRYDVTDFGAEAVDPADPLAGADSTQAFQAAIDEATAHGGGLVYVPAGLYRIDLWLEIGASRIVLAGDGSDLSRLWFTRRVGLNFESHIQVRGVGTPDHTTLLTTDAATFDVTVEVDDASRLAPGDDVVLGHILDADHVAALGMNEPWADFIDTWQPLYRRTVVAIDATSTPQRVTLDVPLRGPLAVASGARLERVTGLLHEVGLEHLGIADATSWEEAWAGRGIHAIALQHVADGWLRDVVSFPSPGAPTSGKGAGAHLMAGGILLADSKRVTVTDCHLERAQNRGDGDGHLFEIWRSNEILTRDSSARHGRHNFIQTGGFGTSGCVWLRVAASDGAAVPLGPLFDATQPAPSTFQFGMTTANLVDSSAFDDDFYAVNRASFGHAATECVFWGFSGRLLMSAQYGEGYVIGTSSETDLLTSLDLEYAAGTAPEDWVEGRGAAQLLVPASLYEDQLARRLAARRPRTP